MLSITKPKVKETYVSKTPGKNTQKIQGSPDVLVRVTVIQSYVFTHLQYGFITCNIHYIGVAKIKMLYF